MFKYAQLVKLARMSLARKLFVLKNVENSAMARAGKYRALADLAAKKNNPYAFRNYVQKINQTTPLVERAKAKKYALEGLAYKELLRRQAQRLASTV